MREGEIVDAAAVTDAIARLRTELGLRRARVRVGVASPRLIVRQVEMPVMTREELAGALRFQAQELIPIPLDEAVIDFAILGTVETQPGEPVMQVLLAAAHVGDRRAAWSTRSRAPVSESSRSTSSRSR